MKSETKSSLSSLSDDELLFEGAFKLSDYTMEVQRILVDQLISRGYTQIDIQKFRKNNLRSLSANVNCAFCSEYLELQEDDLLAGEFLCPECKKKQLVIFSDKLYEIRPTMKQKSKKDLQGLEGWLSLWFIGFIWGIICSIALIGVEIKENNISGAFIGFIFLAATVYLFLLFLDKKRGFPRLAIIYLVVHIVLAFTIAIQRNSEYYMRQGIGLCISEAIWIAYLLRSKRVRVTFINEGWIPFLRGKSQKDIDSLEPLSITENLCSRKSDNIQNDLNEPKQAINAGPQSDIIAVLCKNCRSKIKKDFDFCPKCGQGVELVLCANCSTELKLDFDFCTNCGAKLERKN